MKGNTILLIDDDNRNIFALSAMLRAKGYHTVSALSAKEGLVMAKKQNAPGAILLDMMMPEMDGYEALRILKSDAALEQIPVFAVTAQAMVGDRERCLEAGADEYISKPVDVDALLALLKKHKVVTTHER